MQKVVSEKKSFPINTNGTGVLSYFQFQSLFSGNDAGSGRFNWPFYNAL